MALAKSVLERGGRCEAVSLWISSWTPVKMTDAVRTTETFDSCREPIGELEQGRDLAWSRAVNDIKDGSRRDPNLLSNSIKSISTSIMLDPTYGSGSAVRAAEITRGEARSLGMAVDRNGHAVSSGTIRMLKLEKSSGVEAPRKKNTFLAPHPLQGFLSGRGCAPGFRPPPRGQQ